jgi:hypothetical protein
MAFTSDISACLTFPKANLAASRAGRASSSATAASASSLAILTLWTAKYSFFSVATYCCLAAISDFSVISAIISPTTFFFSAISSFLIASSLLSISVSSYALARVVRPPSSLLVLESICFLLVARKVM